MEGYKQEKVPDKCLIFTSTIKIINSFVFTEVCYQHTIGHTNTTDLYRYFWKFLYVL